MNKRENLVFFIILEVCSPWVVDPTALVVLWVYCGTLCSDCVEQNCSHDSESKERVRMFWCFSVIAKNTLSIT